MALSYGDIAVTPLASGDEPAWTEFLAASANGTLFHDLTFLNYHAIGRFTFHHLILRHAGRIVALLPGGLTGGDGGATFRSPLGASIGGLVVAPGLRAELALALVEALQNHARDRRWAAIELTLPPQCYSQETAGSVDFALFSKGFSLQNRWLCP